MKLLLISMFCLQLFAQDKVPKICNDLASFTCGPGTYDDGTGIAENSSQRLNAIKKKAEEKSRELAENLVTNADPRLREILLSATGLAGSPFCDSPEKEDLKNCNENLVKGTAAYLKKLSQMGRQKEYNLFGIKTSENNYHDLRLLVANPKFQSAQIQLAKVLSADLVNTKALDKIRTDIFPKVKNLLIELIQRNVQQTDLRQQMVDKVSAIELSEMYGCGPGDDSENLKYSVAPLVEANAEYSMSANTFRICSGALLNNTSEFNILGMIAHELGHSIDPCGITQGPSGFAFKYPKGGDQQTTEASYPFAGLITCLRGEASVGALRNSVNSGFGTMGGMGGMGGVPVMGGYGGPSQQAIPQPFSGFCNGDDQIGESVADWIATEVSTDYFEKYHKELTTRQLQLGYSNIFRGRCYPPPEKFDVHPTLERRLNSITLVHPKVRSQMGCPPNAENYSYCGLGTSQPPERPKEGSFTR